MMTPIRVLRPARRVLASALLTAVAGVAIATAAPTATTATAPATAPATTLAATSVYPAMGSDAYESKVQYWINVRRGQHGLRALTLQSCTDKVAEHWGSYLAANDAFYHQSMGAILDKCNAYYAGETLGRGAISPKHLVYLWMHSPEHRAVLLSKYPHRIGIGAYPDAFGEWVVAADFTKF